MATARFFRPRAAPRETDLCLSGPAPYAKWQYRSGGLRRLSAAVLVFPGNGDGTFRAPLTFPTGARCNSIAVGDISGDGRPDIVTATKGNLVVLINSGSE